MLVWGVKGFGGILIVRGLGVLRGRVMAGWGRLEAFPAHARPSPPPPPPNQTLPPLAWALAGARSKHSPNHHPPTHLPSTPSFSQSNAACLGLGNGWGKV